MSNLSAELSDLPLQYLVHVLELCVGLFQAHGYERLLAAREKTCAYPHECMGHEGVT